MSLRTAFLFHTAVAAISADSRVRAGAVFLVAGNAMPARVTDIASAVKEADSFFDQDRDRKHSARELGWDTKPLADKVKMDAARAKRDRRAAIRSRHATEEP